MLGESFSEVLGAARAGEERAFALLYRELNAPVRRYFASQVPAEAEDLASETWLAVARGLQSFEGDERAFRAWFFTIAHRRLVQHWRDAARRPAQERAPETLDALRASADTESDVMAVMDAVAAAQALTALLTPDQAQVVLLRVLGGLSVEEVATALGKRPGTVRVLQHRALRNLAGTFSLEGVTP